MASLLKNMLGGNAPQNPAATPEDADFADFAGAPQPSPIPSVYNAASSSLAASAETTSSYRGQPLIRPYTKWYRVWERVTIADFYSELFILPFIIVIVLVHLWGTRQNRRKVRSWASAHKRILDSEYALVGFERLPKAGSSDSAGGGPDEPMTIMKQKKATEYTSYATGRQNVAFTDFKITLARRHNPPMRIGEAALGLFMESQAPTVERMEANTFAFDGKETELAPLLGAQVTEQGLQPPTPEQKAAVKGDFKSSFDGFVFAVVNKDLMKRLREERYDLSLTSTKDHQRLPGWAAVMSESAEITESLLTPELIKAIESAGERQFESLIISDMPIDAPRKLNDIVPRKRLSLSLRLPSNDQYSNTQSLFQYFLRLPDHLAQVSRYRSEAMRRVKTTREEERKKIKAKFESEAAEERKNVADKGKKEERDNRLRGLSADEQRKALEKERAQDLRKGQRKKTMRQ
ncbi:MAG: hypothetical protein Q9162_003052 [Coniocarpon cinnabarinum]